MSDRDTAQENIFFCLTLAERRLEVDDNFYKLNSKSCYLLMRAKTKSHTERWSQPSQNITITTVLCALVTEHWPLMFPSSETHFTICIFLLS